MGRTQQQRWVSQTHSSRKRRSSGDSNPPLKKKILSAKSTDLALQADDIFFMPNSKVKTVTSKGLDAALQAATGVAIYGRY
jgi:hypothetical protein